jgi:hypothetical protein
MTPDTAFLIGQGIRHSRSLLSSVMKWNIRQPHSSTRIEIFEVVAFCRDVLNVAERKIASGNIHSIGSASESQSQGSGQGQ